MARLGDPAEGMLRNEIEEQVRGWSATLEAAAAPDQATAHLPAEIHPYIAVSREAGAGGSQVIKHVATSLEFDIIDREMLDYLAERYQLPRDMLELVDEKVANWLTEAFGMWLAHRMVSQSDYYMLLGRFVLMAAHNTSAIFAGRGIQFILPREKGLTVRIVAPVERRIERMMKRLQLSRGEAERYVTKRDAGRRESVRRNFRQDVTNPLLYDLVINTENIAYDEAAQIIVRQWRERFGSPLPKTPR